MLKARESIVDRSDSFLKRLFERSSDAHDFTDAFHATAQQTADTVELLEIPAGDLDHDIVQTGLKTSTSDFSNRVFNLIQRNAQAKFCSNKCQRIAGRF